MREKREEDVGWSHTAKVSPEQFSIYVCVCVCVPLHTNEIVNKQRKTWFVLFPPFNQHEKNEGNEQIILKKKWTAQTGFASGATDGNQVARIGNHRLDECNQIGVKFCRDDQNGQLDGKRIETYCIHFSQWRRARFSFSFLLIIIIIFF